MASYPDVPDAAGVPPVLRTINAVEDSLVLLTADSDLLFEAFAPPVWGLFANDGSPAVVADSVISVDYRKEFRISDFPIEQGGFASYNKVQVPADVRITFAQGDGEDDRAVFLAAVASAVSSLNLLTVITPEASYQNMNPVHYDYRRSVRSGAALLLVDIWLEEVRPASAAQYTQSQGTTASGDVAAGQAGSSVAPVTSTTLPSIGADTQSPSASATVNQGTVQTQSPNAAQTAATPDLAAAPGFSTPYAEL